jgi:NAD(P)-dependent dehydrogenase (short-subunit alcohol dehydrogenase family)
MEVAAAEVRSQGGQVWGISGDIGSLEGADRLFGEASAYLGVPTLIIHCASSLGPVPLLPTVELSREEIRQVFNVNLFGAIQLFQRAIGPMELAGKGTLLAISSDAATSAYARWGAYGASKAALDHWCRILAEEHPSLQIVTADPGEMNTRMHADAIPEADPASLADPRVVARVLKSWLESGWNSGTRRTVTRGV